MATMGATVIREFGDPDVLQWAAVPRPEIRPHDVLVKVHACGVNHLDLWTRRGAAGDVAFPHILGSEPAGVVEAVGAEVFTLAVGDRVVVAPGYLEHFHADRSGWDARFPDYKVLGNASPGGYGEYVCARAENVLPVSDRWSLEEWAATPLVFLTAWHMLLGRAGVHTGETVLVIGGGSGVGSAAIQIARHLGARVLATAGSAGKLERAAELGAEAGVNHREEDWPKQVRALTGGRGVDVVVEHVGGDVFSRAITTLAYGGRLVTCGATIGSGGQIDVTHLFAKQLSVLGSYMGDFSELKEVLRHLETAHLRPVVDQLIPVRDAAEAHRRMEARAHFGKIVLKHD